MKVLDKSAFSVAIASSKSAGIFTCLRGGNSTPQEWGMRNCIYSDLAPSKKVTGGERQKAKGKRQNG
jgi:hypothetical protein